MNEDITTVGGLDATQVLAVSNDITNLGQLWMVLQAMKPEKYPQGITCHLQVLDQQKTTLFVNSQLLMAPLTAEFQRLGKQLEAQGINLEKLFEQLQTRFDSLYK